MPVGDVCVRRSASRNNSGWFSFKVKAQAKPRRSTSLTKGDCIYKASPTKTSRNRRPNCFVEILEQSQCTGYLSFAVLLKAKTQGDGERRADHGDHDDPVIVLNIGSHLAVHLMLNFPLHAGVATPDERAADFDAIDRRHHQPSGPVGVEDSIAF